VSSQPEFPCQCKSQVRLPTSRPITGLGFSDLSFSVFHMHVSSWKTRRQVPARPQHRCSHHLLLFLQRLVVAAATVAYLSRPRNLQYSDYCDVARLLKMAGLYKMMIRISQVTLSFDKNFNNSQYRISKSLNLQKDIKYDIKRRLSNSNSDQVFYS
jgi:hypothetical protein